MVKKFSVPCDFGGVSSPFTIYLGDPEPTHHPLHFQAEWLGKVRGGTIPGDVMDSISKLYELSKKNNVPFEELCAYALADDPNKVKGFDDNFDNNNASADEPTAPEDEAPMPIMDE